MNVKRKLGLWAGVVFVGFSMLSGCQFADLRADRADRMPPTEVAVLAEGQAYRFDQVVTAARQAALAPNADADAPLTLHAASADLPPALAEMLYDGFVDIGFDHDQAELLGEGAADGYSMQGFHRGWLYHDPVHIELVADGRARPWPYNPDAFTFGKDAPQPDDTWGDLGWAGLKINRAWEVGEDSAELMVMLGASYFRALGADSVYGASGRLIAVNTGIPGTAESFPRVTSLWVHEQADRDDPLRIDGYLAGEHLTGAFSLLIHPGKTTAIDVDLHLFVHRPIQKLGLAPITSMYMFGPEPDPRFRDHRPEVHDNDALLVHSEKQTYFQPLRNPYTDRTTRLDPAQGMTGFGLIQRERRFDRYLDEVTRHELRPDVYVRPNNRWPEGAVELLELARTEEKVDNIGCYYAVDNVAAGTELHVQYTVGFGSPIAELHATKQDYTQPDRDDDNNASDEPSRLLLSNSSAVDPKHLAQAQRVVFARTPWPHWSIIFDGPALRELEEGAFVPCHVVDRDGEQVIPAVKILPDGRWQVDLSEDLAYPVDVRFEDFGVPLTETVRLQEPNP